MHVRPEDTGATDEPTELGELWQVRPVGQGWQAVSSSSLLFSPDRKEFSLVRKLETEGQDSTFAPKPASTPSKYGGQLTLAKWRELRARLNTSLGGRWGSFGEVMGI